MPDDGRPMAPMGSRWANRDVRRRAVLGNFARTRPASTAGGSCRASRGRSRRDLLPRDQDTFAAGDREHDRITPSGMWIEPHVATANSDAHFGRAPSERVHHSGGCQHERTELDLDFVCKQTDRPSTGLVGQPSRSPVDAPSRRFGRACPPDLHLEP